MPFSKNEARSERLPSGGRHERKRRQRRQRVTALVAAGLVAGGVLFSVSRADATEQDKCKTFRGNSSAVTTARLNPGGSSISATFTVKDGCQVQVSLASYTMPGPFVYGDWKSYDQQKLFSSSGGHFGPGSHTLTARIPDCYWQTDLVFGGVKTPPYYGEKLITAEHGGSNVCEKPKPIPTTTTQTTAPPVDEQPLVETPKVGTPTSKKRTRTEPSPDDSIDIDEGPPELGIPSKDAKVPPKWRKRFTG